MNRIFTGQHCRIFTGHKPCDVHKETLVQCEECDRYDPIENRILIIKMGAPGDMLRTTSLLPIIHKNWPNAFITWIVSKESEELLEKNPLVDRIIVWDADNTPIVFSQFYDIAINFDQTVLSSSILAVVDAHKKFGFILDDNGVIKPTNDSAFEWYAMGIDDTLKKKNRQTYQEIACKLMEVPYEKHEYILDLGRDEKEATIAHIKWFDWFTKKEPIGINTGTGNRWRYKKWTYEGFQTLIDKLIEDGEKILLFGGPDDNDFNMRLKHNSKKIITFNDLDVLLYQPSIRTLASFIGCCKLLVTGDTLAMHLAIAMKKPTVVLFGPTSPWEIELYDRGKKVITGLDCMCCYRQDCDVKPNCMESISVDMVYDAVREVLPSRK